MAKGRPFAFGTDAWDISHRFETSWILSPWMLFFLRALFCLYIFTTLVFGLIWECYNALDRCASSEASFSYFTSLTYWGLGFYFLAASVHTFTYARSGVPLIDRFPRPLQALHSALYTTIVVFPFIVTIVYWAMLYSGPWFPVTYDGWSNVSKHAMNAGFALFEIVVPRTDTLPAVHMVWIVLVLALYLGVAYITRATKGFYTYGFLDPGKQGKLVAAYVFGIAVGGLIFFGIATGLIWLRKWITERKLGMEGKFAERDKTAQVGDVEMSAASKVPPA